MKALEFFLNFVWFDVINPLFDIIKNIVTLLCDKFGTVPGILISIFAGCVSLGIIKGVLEVIFEKIFGERLTAEEREGAFFEDSTSIYLESTFHTKPIRNLLFPNKNGGTTELDMAFVNSKGIFCIECKKRGEKHTATGYLTDDVWEIKESGVFHHSTMNNPIFQNNGHIAALKSVFLQNLHCNTYNVVYMDTSYDFMYNGVHYQGNFIALNEEKVILVRHKEGIEEFKSYVSSLPNVYNVNDITTIEEFLKRYKATKKQLKEHKERLQLIEYRKRHNIENH